MSVLFWVIHRQVLGLSQCTFFLDAGCYTCVQQQAQGQGCVDDSENEESFGNVLIHNAQLDEKLGELQSRLQSAKTLLFYLKTKPWY